MANLQKTAAIMLPTTALALPEVELMPSGLINSEFYGASAVAALYCGFKDPPATPRGYWMHGWGPKQWLELGSPELYFGLCDLHDKNDYHWVGRLDEEDLLRRHGYSNAKAIGLPIVYVGHKEIARRPGSLLVMPAHSSDDSTSDWRFEEYAEKIERLKADFSEVYVCVHPSCWEHGYWVEAFKRRGFPMVAGALYTDRNALERMYRLLTSFEYVTTNSAGSHIAYAAYLGAKVSIYGPYAELADTNFNNIPVHLPLKDRWVWANSERTMRQYYPELFCQPAAAKQKIDWGRYEVGYENKVTPAELRSLFRWTSGAQLTARAQSAAHAVCAKVRDCLRVAIPSRLRHRRRLRRDPEFRRQWEYRAEVERLERVPRNTTMVTNLVGGCFELMDSKSFLAQHSAIFVQQIYRFESRKEAPRIIDGGANVGLSVLFFKRSYPKSRILAFEPDPAIFPVLAKNAAAHQWENVELIPKALWTGEGIVKFNRDGADAGRIVARTNSLQAVDVCTCRLKDYLDQEVDLLKLDLEGAELDVLVDCQAVLGNVQKIVVEYHSFREQPQKLHLLLQVLHDAGFRLHVNGGLVSPQPLWWRQVSQGMDMRLYLYGFRR